MIELLAPHRLHEKGRQVLRSFRAGCPDECIATDRYKGSGVVVAWGPGAPEQQAVMRQVIKAGGKFIAFDLGYWSRVGADRKLRVTINACHPQELVMRRDEAPERLVADGIGLRYDGSDQGYVVLVGMGEKSRRQLTTTGRPVTELDLLTRIRSSAVYGKRQIIYRPKGSSRERLQGCETVNRDQMSIEALMQGAALVVTRHSNGAVDAIIAGVPAVCDDGAAAAVLGNDLSRPVARLSDDQRLRFLRNLAWWQWSEAEMRDGSMWKWLKTWL